MGNLLIDIITALEGPYKWYAMVIALGLLTLALTKTFFKAVKWLLIIAFIIIAILIIASFAEVIQF